MLGNHLNLNVFIWGRLRNNLSQLILITLDRSFRMESISYFWTKFKKRDARSFLYAKR